MNEGHGTLAPGVSLGRARCLLCSKQCLQGYGAGSIKCWWCGTIFPSEWVIGALWERLQRKVTEPASALID